MNNLIKGKVMILPKNLNDTSTCKKIVINIKLDTFIKNVNHEEIKNHSNDLLDKMLTRFVQKYKNIEHFLDALVIKLVVDHENKAVLDFNSKHIIFYYEFENIILLNKILISNSSYGKKEISVHFIIDNPSNKNCHKIEDYVISLAKYESNKDNKHEVFENSFLKSPSRFVKNAKKSIINSLYQTNPKEQFRISNSQNIVNIESIKDTIEYKYLNLQCPICAKISKDAKKYEITEETIDNIITIEKNTSRISFNCLHENLEIEKGKFYLTPSKYNIEMNNYDDRTLQIWTLKNFKYLAKEALDENNYSI